MNPRDIEKATRAISKARAQLILNAPFWATLALRLDPVPDMRAQTIATDGRRILFNPMWINERKPEELPGLIAHEAGHVMLNHAWRRQNREHERFNVACDHALNPLLVESDFVLPKGGCSVVKRKPDFPGKAAEQIYPLLPEMPPMFGAGGGDGSLPDFGGTGCVLDAAGADGKPLTEAERNQLEAEWKIATLQAAQAAKAQGKLPVGLETLADSIRAPQVDWRAVLREFVRSVVAGDYSWKRPNVRMLAGGDYLPSLWSEEVGPLLWGRDSSGSVAQREHEQVASELTACCEAICPETVDVICLDTMIQSHETYTPADYPLIARKIKGGGGTHLAPLWPYLAERDLRPCAVIFSTDMELCVRDLGEDPGVPVLWLSTGRDVPMDGPLPFGTLVRVEA